MTVTASPPLDLAAQESASVATSPSASPLPLALGLAAIASAGAGIIHVAAAGAHGEHRPAATAFALLAVLQLGWAVLALGHHGRVVAASGVALGAAAVVGWRMATTVGVEAISGLDRPADPQWADTAAAVLAAATLIGAGLAVTRARRRSRPMSPPSRLAVGVSALVVAAALVPTVVAAGSHDHAHGDPAARADNTAADDHVASAVPPTPYDPAKPIDLGGVDGVTPEQQARAENLVAVTLLRLPRYADHRVAEAAGYRSIGDGVTGYEHFVLWSSINDDRILDPDVPESLVYKIDGASKTLVAAMFMLRDGDTLDSVPDVGGRLTQWHIHNNLCYTPDPEQPLVRGLTDADGTCRPPLVKGREIPMIHVWITPHECGPFAALEGVGAGQIKPGEARWCDHAHGA